MRFIAIAASAAALTLGALAFTSGSASAAREHPSAIKCSIFQAAPGTQIGEVYGTRQDLLNGRRSRAPLTYSKRRCFNSRRDCLAWVEWQFRDRLNSISRSRCYIK